MIESDVLSIHGKFSNNTKNQTGRNNNKNLGFSMTEALSIHGKFSRMRTILLWQSIHGLLSQVEAFATYLNWLIPHGFSRVVCWFTNANRFRIIYCPYNVHRMWYCRARGAVDGRQWSLVGQWSQTANPFAYWLSNTVFRACGAYFLKGAIVYNYYSFY